MGFRVWSVHAFPPWLRSHWVPRSRSTLVLLSICPAVTCSSWDTSEILRQGQVSLTGSFGTVNI